MAAENAVNGMMNVLRATFKQPATPVTTAVATISVPMIQTASGHAAVVRSSSASRGRGLARLQKN